MRPDALLLDLDGVTRHWRDTGARDGERRAGLPAGALDVAYQLPEYTLAQLGVLTDQQWADTVQHHLITTYGPQAAQAIGPWRADRGDIDPIMLDLIHAARAHLPVAILSNTTDALPADLHHHGLADAFDAVFTSAQLGVAKPAPTVYRLAVAALGLPPHQVFFTDDETLHVRGAKAAGLPAPTFTTPAAFAAQLHRLGLTLPAALHALA